MKAELYDTYWYFLTDAPCRVIFSGNTTKKEHAQMQWLFQGAVMHMCLQGQVAMDTDMKFDFQIRVQDDLRLYSPIGIYMNEDDFDYMSHSSYIPDFFLKDLWLRELVSRNIGWELTDDQAIMLSHLEVIHDHFPYDEIYEQFAHVATHFGLWLPEKEAPNINATVPRAAQPELRLEVVH